MCPLQGNDARAIVPVPATWPWPCAHEYRRSRDDMLSAWKHRMFAEEQDAGPANRAFRDTVDKVCKDAR